MEAPLPKEVNLFSTPELTAPYEKVQYTEYRSPTPLNEGGPLQFLIPPQANQLIDLARSRLHVTAVIVRDDGKAQTDEDICVPVTNTLHSLFSLVEVDLQQTLVSTNQYYGYKAYLETLLENDQSAVDTHLRRQLFTKDPSVAIDEVVNPRESSGLLYRYDHFKTAQSVAMSSALMSDICQQDRAIVNGVEIGVRLWPARDDFVLLTDKPYMTMRLKEVYLSICKITPSPPVMFGLMDTLKEKPAQYPFTRTEIRTYQLARGQLGFHFEDIYQQQVPTEMIICMVLASGFHGNKLKNPYSFNHFDLSELSLHIDDDVIPKALKMNWTKHDYLDAYSMLFDNPPEDKNTPITLDDFNKGYTIFRYKITPPEVQSLTQTRGNVKLTGTFKVALPANVTLLILGKFHQMLTIDNSRKVTI